MSWKSKTTVSTEELRQRNLELSVLRAIAEVLKNEVNLGREAVRARHGGELPGSVAGGVFMA